ncbi:MAG: RHS repeat-associated core domain-containing protein, partial [Acidobacteriota bacterium]|nr:RHS repeat-associated core domain-containing protein [Acidobacteriota bacterium]
HRDHLGSTRLMTDENGIEIGRWKYFPFGMEATVEESGDQRMKFTGHDRDGEVELDYMLARYHGISLARLLSVDPSGRSARRGAPQTWNRFSYSVNNALNRVDPDGRLSYLVARNGPANSSHMFSVTHARYVGDPNARVFSFGKSSRKGSDGKLGRVDNKTTGLSKGTATKDQEVWKSLGTNDAAAGVDYVAIAAKDGKVASVASALVENKDYSLLGPNSNSAAQATADKAQGSPVATPDRFDPAVGAGDADEVEFDENQISQDKAAGEHDEHVRAQARPSS